MLKKVIFPLFYFSFVFANIPAHGNCSPVNVCHCEKNTQGICYAHTGYTSADEYYPKCYNDMANGCKSDCKTFCDNLPNCDYSQASSDKSCKSW